MAGPESRLTEAELDLLRAVDTPTVCNVIELFDVRPRNAGYMDGRIRASSPELPPMVGYATTATFRSNAPPRAGDAYSSLDRHLAAIEAAPKPAVVVFQDLDDPPRAATFGEVMCASYQAFGAVGLVASGPGRDLEQVQKLKFPTFVGGAVCSHGYCHILELEVPVNVGGITIYPGDLLHGDRNGVTTIPNEIASAVAGACREFLAAEDEVLHYVRSGSPTVAGFAAARKRMAERIAELTKRLKRG